MKLVKYNPFGEINFFPNSFNDIFNDAFFKPAELSSYLPAVDIVDGKEHVRLHVELPGIKKEDINISIENNVLTISGERKTEADLKKNAFYRKESKYGNFKRMFSLSEDIDLEEVNADYKDGVLKITLKKKEVEKESVRQITVN